MMMLLLTITATSISLISINTFGLFLTFTLMIAITDLSKMSYLSSVWMSAFYLDTMSILLIMLSIIIIMSSWASANYFSPYKEMNLFLVWTILLILILVFSTNSMISFYFWFEVSLLPIFFLIMGWGYQPERLEASKSMFLYTLFGSLPLLILLIIFWKNMTLTLFSSLFQIMPQNSFSALFSFFLMISFLIKFPMYGVHMWLPKAHVEAPVGGSMILAALLLKMGGYGILRLQAFLENMSALRLSLFFFCMIGGSIISILCITQNDMKVLIAYSSVSHMSFAIAGAMAQTKILMWASIMIMLCHGSTSSALFMGANLMYLRNKTRLLTFNKGILSFMPQFSMLWALMCVSNMAGPPSINLFSELVAIISIMASQFSSIIPIAIIGFFGAAYTLILYSATQNLKPACSSSSKLSLSESEINGFFIYLTMTYLLVSVFFSLADML